MAYDPIEDFCNHCGRLPCVCRVRRKSTGDDPSLIEFVQPVPEFILHKDGPQEWLIEELLPHPSMGLLWGWRGTGKTFCSLSLAIAVAGKGRWLKSSMVAKKERVVLYVDGELPGRELRKRFRLLTGGKPPAKLFIMPLEEFVVRGGAKPNMREAAGRREIDRLIKDVEGQFGVSVELVVFDSWIFLARGMPENENSKELGEILDWASGHRAKNRSFLFLHHAGKARMDKEGNWSGGDQRGTSAREDPMDYVVALRKAGPEDGPAQFLFTLEKSRQLVRCKPFEAILRERKGEAAIWETTTKRQKIAVMEDMLIEADEPLSLRKLAAAAKMSGGDAKAALKRLKEDGVVDCTDDGWFWVGERV